LAEREKKTGVPPQFSYGGGARFRVAIPNVEIEFHSADVKEVHKRFDEVMVYMQALLNEKRLEESKKHDR
jgi:hypothetical protein